MFFENGKAVNQAAKTVAQFMAEKGAPLAHHDALDLIARLQGFPSHEAANARLKGIRQGMPQALKSWADLFQVIACMNDTERRGSITLSEGSDTRGDAEFVQSELIVKATDASIARAAGAALAPSDFVLIYQAGRLAEESAESRKTAHRIAMQAELLSGEPGAYAKSYAAMRRDSLLFVQQFNRQWEVALMDGPWVVYSQKEEGYWHLNFGWVSDRDSATGYAEESEALAAARFIVGSDDAEVRYEP